MSRASHAELSIGQLAALAGVTRRAVRYYEQQRLLSKPKRTEAGYRRYNASAVVQLIHIRRLRELGLGIDQIRAALVGTATAATLREALVQLEQDLDERAKALHLLRDRVREILRSNEDEFETSDVWRRLLEQARKSKAEPGGGPGGRSTLPDMAEIAQSIGGEELASDLGTRLADPAFLERFEALSRRLKALEEVPPEEAEPEVELLAAELAALLPRQLLPGPLAETAMFTILLGEHLGLAQVRCLERAWQRAHDL
jgi:DNA-binding transcriptional MerR regulator